MFQAKFVIIKCVTALVIAFSSVTALVAFAAADSVSTVIVTDGDNSFEVSTYCSTVEEILSENQITLGEGDVAALSFENGVGLLNIKRSFPVYITKGESTTTVNMTEGTVAEALELAGVALGQYDLCNKDVSDILNSESYIDVISVEYETKTYEETIPYTTKVEYSSKLASGEKKVSQGKNGTKTVTVRQKIENGIVTSTEVISETVTKSAVAETTVIGTKERKSSSKTETKSSGKTVNTVSALGSVKVDENGVPLSYTKSMTMRASAYTSEKGAVCSTGVTAQTGYIAVNPNIIPYGTKMYIVSNDGSYVYGYAIAADTGGFASRNPYMVDLYFNSVKECVTFGIRNVTIYFLDQLKVSLKVEIL